MGVVIKRRMIWGSNCHPKKSPVVGICDGCVKYEEAEFDRLEAILKTNKCKQAARLWLLNNTRHR